ncbi:RNAse P Rpr2/Rpp21/SNM1 subunit domain-domain-containing protein [Syncephalastrum racemosum]|uniref:RNAse P Rpr2/Rpp21/SNM1 subunit domain-domain-containing protein n=1 Tax=Syncephalastrum racemosum TaxID=13706 RepID=A0A1X2H260_SYNRA|nr:RNAse P Rpr2/Rpp21/SNM1 subunit domain-domain-containing protein [Syncephalastrum racemosum]
MGKKKTNNDVNPQHMQTFQRLNFLYQAAALMTLTSVPSNESNSTKTKSSSISEDRTINDGRTSLAPVGRYYNANMKKIAKHLVLRLDPAIKRSVCKRCHTSLIPSKSSNICFKADERPATIVTCKTCGTERRFLARPAHRLFSEKSENILQFVGHIHPAIGSDL